jgi:ABC-2 type transport system permease protein
LDVDRTADAGRRAALAGKVASAMKETLSRILNLIRKELTHLSRDRILTPMLMLGPLIELILIGIATSSDIQHLPTRVLDRDDGPRGAALVQMLEASPVFDLGPSVADEVQARKLLQKGEITAVFIIPEDFSRSLVNPQEVQPTAVRLLLDGADTFAAQAARYAAEESVDNLATLISMGWREQGGTSLASLELPKIEVLYNRQLKKSFYELPAEMGIMLYFVTAGVASLGIARERERGTWEQLLVTPMRPVEVVLGKALPAIPIAYIVFLLMLTVSLVGFGLPMRGSWPLLLAVVFLYILVELSVGVLMSALSDSQIQALLLVLVLMMIEFIFSGYVFAVDTMPPVVQVLANFIPMNHGLNMVRSILLRGVGFGAIWSSVLMLMLLGSGIMAITTLVLRRRLD